MAVTAALPIRGLLLGALLHGAAIFSGPALAGDQMPAACRGATFKSVPPMPAPPGIKPNEPMPTGMAKPGAMQGDVMMFAAENKHCMDQQLERDQSSMPTKPKQ